MRTKHNKDMSEDDIMILKGQSGPITLKLQENIPMQKQMVNHSIDSNFYVKSHAFNCKYKQDKINNKNYTIYMQKDRQNYMKPVVQNTFR